MTDRPTDQQTNQQTALGRGFIWKLQQQSGLYNTFTRETKRNLTDF